jgi:hypothetical protein
MATLVSTGSPASKSSRKPTPSNASLKGDGAELAAANALAVRFFHFDFTF